MLVHSCCSVLQRCVVSVKVRKCRLDRRVSEDVAHNVDRNAGVGEPRGACMSKVVTAQPWQPQRCNQLVPAGCVTQCCRGDDTATRPAQQWQVACPLQRESAQHWFERRNDRHAARPTSLRRLDTQATSAGEALSFDRDHLVLPIDIADDEPAYFRTARGEERAEHDVVAVASVDVSAGRSDPRDIVGSRN